VKEKREKAKKMREKKKKTKKVDHPDHFIVCIGGWGMGVVTKIVFQERGRAGCCLDHSKPPEIGRVLINKQSLCPPGGGSKEDPHGVILKLKRLLNLLISHPAFVSFWNST